MHHVIRADGEGQRVVLTVKKVLAGRGAVDYYLAQTRRGQPWPARAAAELLLTGRQLSRLDTIVGGMCSRLPPTTHGSPEGSGRSVESVSEGSGVRHAG